MQTTVREQRKIERDNCGPIRTYAQTVAIMRKRGDATITISSATWYERNAMKKLRKELADLAELIGS